MNECQELLKQLLDAATPYNGSGCECTFFILPNGVGCKCYDSRRKRDGCFRRQQFLADNGLAPTVYERFECSHYFVYTTQVVSPLVESTESSMRANAAFYARLSDSERLDLDIERQRIMSRLCELDLEWADDHLGNFGRDENGTLLIIDCSDEYMQSF